MKRKPKEKWGDYLFRCVESAQGAAYISDGIDRMGKAEVVALARAAKWAHYDAIAAINDFLLVALREPKRKRK